MPEQFSAEIAASNKETKQVIVQNKDDLGGFIDQILDGATCKNVHSYIDTEIYYQG